MESQNQQGQETSLEAYQFPSRPAFAEDFAQNMTTFQLQTNHFDIDFNSLEVHQYHMVITPSIPEDSRQVRQKIIKSYENQIIQQLGNYYTSGLSLYCLKCNKETLSYSGQGEYSVALEYDGNIDLNNLFSKDNSVNKTQPLQYMNVMVKNLLQDLKFFEIGTNAQFYQKSTDFQNQVGKTPLDVWSGYKTSVDMYDGMKVKMLIDFSSRILRYNSVNDQMKELFNQARKGGRNRRQRVNVEQLFQKEIVGRSVLADYGNHHIYRVHSIDVKKSPKDTIQDSNETFLEYYQKNYNIKIRDQDQPLLVVQQHTDNKLIYLVPELCRMAGLSAKQRKDKRLMDQIAIHTRLDPNERYNRIQNLAEQLFKGEQNMVEASFPTQSPEVEAIRLQPPKIITAKGQQAYVKDGLFQVKAIQEEGVQLNNWACIYTSFGDRDQKSYNQVDEFVYQFSQAAANLGVTVQEPVWEWVHPKNFKKSVAQKVRQLKRNNPDLEFIMFFIDDKCSKFYTDIKQETLPNLGIINSVVKVNTVLLKDRNQQRGGRGRQQRQGKPKMNMSIMYNIAFQILGKTRKVLWKAETPAGIPEHTMLIGADVFHNTRNNKKSVVGFCASMDRDFTKFYSQAHVQDEEGQELVYVMGDLMRNALEEYQSVNGRLPEMIVFYRDGVGESQTALIMDVELPAINETFASFTENGQAYNPKYTEILVNKRIDDRFFLNERYNPEPGTMIYSDVVSNNFEFLLIPHKVTVGTVTPTKYFVITDNTGMSLDQFGQLTYNQCYNFANWQGAVRFPGVCFYAHKIAYLCGQNDLKPTESLQKYLYFL